MAYRVVVPYATVKVNNEGMKPTVYGFYEGALLPSNADAENVKILLAKGMVESVAPVAVAEPAKVAAEAKPAKATRE